MHRPRRAGFADRSTVPDGLAPSLPLLQSNLTQVKRRKLQSRTALLGWAGLALFLLYVGSWLVPAGRPASRWQEYVRRLDAASGVVVIQASMKDGKYRVRGLLDRLAVDPRSILDEAEISPEAVEFSWEPYYSLDEDIVGRRARNVLQPPSTVRWSLRDGVLTLSGVADARWVERARTVAPAIVGVDAVRDENLLAQGPTSTLRALLLEVERHRVQFDRNVEDLNRHEEELLEPLVPGIRSLLRLAEAQQRDVVVDVVGSSLASGADFRARLGAQRAAAVVEFLIARGIPEDRLRARVRQESPMGGESASRREVAFTVSFLDDIRTP